MLDQVREIQWKESAYPAPKNFVLQAVSHAPGQNCEPVGTAHANQERRTIQRIYNNLERIPKVNQEAKRGVEIGVIFSYFT